MRFFAAFPIVLASACAPAFSPRPAPVTESAPAWTPPATKGPPSGAVVREACGPVAAVFDDPSLGSFEEARARLDDIEAHPPSGVANEQLAWCKAQIERLIAIQIAYQENVEGYRVVARIARALRAAYAAARSLCPAARPVPAEMPAPGAVHRSTRADWSADPGWSCLGVAIDEPQRFQYEVERSASGFAIVGRRRIAGEVLEIRLEGRVESGEIVFAPNVVESRAPIR